MGDQVWLMTSKHTEPLLHVGQHPNASVGDGHLQFVDVRVEDLVHKANTGAFIRVLLRQLDMDLPYTALIGRYNWAERIEWRQDVVQAKKESKTGT